MPVGVYKRTKKHKENISKAMKGKMPKFIPNNKGRILSEAHKKKISDTNKKKGITWPRPPRECLPRGKNHNWWKGGVSKINDIIKKSFRYREWRKKVFKRDNYSCVWCRYKGNKLVAHHIKSFALFPKLRFRINNGLTLCHECHKTTDSYGRNTYTYKSARQLELSFMVTKLGVILSYE